MRVPGFTALELLIVVAVTAILSALVSIPLSLVQTQAGLTAGVSSTVETLRRAQTQAASGYYADKWGVHFSATSGCALPTSRIWLYRSDVFDSASDTVDAVDLQNGTKITALSIGGGCDVRFLRFAGSTTSTGTVTLTDPNGNSKVVNINGYGRISPP